MLVKDTVTLELWEKGKVVSSIGLEEVKAQGWDLVDFIDFQEDLGRRVKVNDKQEEEING